MSALYTAELLGGTFEGKANQTVPLNGTVNGKCVFTVTADGPNRGCKIVGTFKDNKLNGDCTLFEQNGDRIVSRRYINTATCADKPKQKTTARRSTGGLFGAVQMLFTKKKKKCSS